MPSTVAPSANPFIPLVPNSFAVASAIAFLDKSASLEIISAILFFAYSPSPIFLATTNGANSSSAPFNPPTAMALFTASSGFAPSCILPPKDCPPSNPAVPAKPVIAAPLRVVSSNALEAALRMVSVINSPSTAFNAPCSTPFLTAVPTAAPAISLTAAFAPSRATAPPIPPVSNKDPAKGSCSPNSPAPHSSASEGVLMSSTFATLGAYIAPGWLLAVVSLYPSSPQFVIP